MDNLPTLINEISRRYPDGVPVDSLESVDFPKFETRYKDTLPVIEEGWYSASQDSAV